MQKQSVSIFITHGIQTENKNQTKYEVSKSSTITRSETSDKMESVKTTYRKTK